MNSQQTSVVLVLTGPLTGRTMDINGRRFTNGKCRITAPAHLLHGAVHYYGTYYQAFPEGSAEHLEATRPKEEGDGERDPAEGGQRDGDPEVPGGVQPGGQGLGPQDPAVGEPDGGGEADSNGAPREGDRTPTGDGQPGTAPAWRDDVTRIKDALEQLDPTNDEHWTEGGKPSISVLSDLSGVPVKRKDVDVLAPDFRRPNIESKQS